MTTEEIEDAAQPGASYKLSLMGEGITVERYVSADQARDIIAVVMGEGKRGSGPAAATPRAPGGMSIRELIDHAGAKKNPQIVTVIGLYLMDHEGQDRFTRTEVRYRFSQAGEPPPANIGRDVALAVSSGWVAEDPRNQFYVTDTGRRAVEARFEGHQIRRPRRRVVKKAQASSKNS